MKVFISFSDADRELAKTLSTQLAVKGLVVSNDESEFFPGDDWYEKNSRALKTSDAMVVLYSPEYSQSRWAHSELSFALGEKAFQDRVIPVLVRPTPEQPWVFNHLHTIQFQNDPIRLAAEIDQALAQVGTAAAV